MDARRAQAVLALAVGAAATASPVTLLRPFGLRDVDGAAALGWRLFGVRTAGIAAASLRGSRTAQAAFLPVQLADQAVFAHALRTGAVPPRAAIMAMATSGVIIALDVAARRVTTGGRAA